MWFVGVKHTHIYIYILYHKTKTGGNVSLYFSIHARHCEASWSLVEEFNTQYEELLSQTWLELRPRLFTVQDLAHNWMAKLREVPRDTVTHMLSQEVQRLEAAHPALKAMTGEPFERDHWKILFGLLKMPDLRLEELRFKETLLIFKHIGT